MRILYTSSDVHKAIKTVFDKKHQRRIAIVAYLGENAESFLPSPKGIKIICCPEPGATSPSSVRSLISRGAELQFSDDLHAKVYWSEGGCVITSANISHRALGRTNQKETGVLIDSDNFDIDRLINEIEPYSISQKAMDRLEKQDKKLKRAIERRQKKKTVKHFNDWYKSPYKEPWKIGWWSESDLLTAKSAIEKTKLEYSVAEPVGILNVSKSQVTRNDWLLCFEISGSNTRKIEWMYVDFVVPVEAKDIGAYEEDYPFQAIQVHKLSQYPEPPFVLEKEFRAAFKKAAKEYGTNKIENSKRLVVPKSLINKVADYLK
ncbi:MAG: phospholipase D family protein [Sedimenticola sp.]